MLTDTNAQEQSDESSYFVHVYTTCYTPIYRFVIARVISADIANDIVQDIFTKALPVLEREPARATPLPLLYTIARNTLIDFYRKKKDVHYTIDDLEQDEDGTRSDALALQYERRQIMEKALDLLNEEQRTVITLIFMEELSTDEVAHIIGKTNDVVRQVKSRAQRLMKVFLQQHEI